MVRWYSFMQSLTADACKDLEIAPLDFDYDAINIHMPIPKVMESKKAAKKAAEGAKAEAPKAEAPKAEEEADISKLDIRVGRIIRAWNHPDSEKLSPAKRLTV